MFARSNAPMHLLFLLLVVITFSSCNNSANQLPVYGNKTLVTRTENGKTITDSVDYTIPAFSFVNQDSAIITRETVKNQIFVTDFFFTSCPSICPKMKKEMLRVYDKYKSNNEVSILSFSIDPVRDSVARLKAYSEKLGIENAGKWSMLTGNKDSIYSLAASFLVSAAEDPDAPGGHVHSGNFILIDKLGRLRGYYDGTNTESVDKLLSDIDILLLENP
jgi:protein SCO1/2